MAMSMTVEEVEAALAADRARLIAEQEARQAEILRLMEQQNLDLQGKLWGEKGFDDLAFNTGGPDWEVIHRHLPDFRTPEVILANREICQIALANIRLLGEEVFSLFLAWLDHARPEDLVEEFNISYQEILWKVKAAVRRCREIFHTDPKIFPFRELKGPDRKRLKNRLWLERYRSGAEPQAGEAVRLTDEEKSLSLDALTDLLKGRGVPGTSRGNVWRIQKRGWYYPQGYDHNAWIQGNRVDVSEEDRKLPGTVLARKLGISSFTAQSAKRRGWFMRNSQNSHITPDPTAAVRRPGPGSKDLSSVESRLLAALPRKIEGTPDGKSISEFSTREICEIFGLQMGGGIAPIKRRGWFSTRTWSVARRLEFIQHTEFVDMTTPAGRVDVRVQLAGCGANGWQGMQVHCALCGSELPLGEATIDHIVPKAQGGGDYLSNLQLAHETCNATKGGMAFRTLGEALEKARKEGLVIE